MNTATAKVISLNVRRNAYATVIGMTLSTPKGTVKLADRTYWAGSFLAMHLKGA